MHPQMRDLCASVTISFPEETGLCHEKRGKQAKMNKISMAFVENAPL